MTSDEVQDIKTSGYGKPPVSTRFKKGTSGNPKGRPRGGTKDLPYESVLGQIVTVNEDGVEKRVTAEEAFMLKLMKDSFAGDASAIDGMLASLEVAKAARMELAPPERLDIVISFVNPGSVRTALEALRMGRNLDRFRNTARVLLEPWIVEAALARRGDDPLSINEQRTVLNATRTPWNVKWPDWWSIEG